MKTNLAVAATVLSLSLLATVWFFSVRGEPSPPPPPPEAAASIPHSDPSTATRGAEPERPVLTTISGVDSNAVIVRAPSYTPRKDFDYTAKWKSVEEPLTLRLRAYRGTVKLPGLSTQEIDWLIQDAVEFLGVLTSGTVDEGAEYAARKGMALRPSMVKGELAQRQRSWLSMAASYREAEMEVQQAAVAMYMPDVADERGRALFGAPRSESLLEPSRVQASAAGALACEILIPGVFRSAMGTTERGTVGFIFINGANDGRWRPWGVKHYGFAGETPGVLPFD